ncbi:MAG: PilN domain-containing protein [Magnetococcus sp. YQC-5]
MILQQVNFYHDIYRPKFDPLEARSIILFTVGMLVLLLVVTGGMQWRLSVEKKSLKGLEKNRDAALERVTELSSRYPVREADPVLVREVKKLEQEKMRKNAMLSLLKAGRIGSSSGFSPMVRELAAARTKGVWLTGIGVFEGGGQLMIEGAAHTNESDRIPELLGAIANRPVFADRRFSHFRVVESETSPGMLQFHLKTGNVDLERFWEEKKDPDALKKPRIGEEEARVVERPPT